MLNIIRFNPRFVEEKKTNSNKEAAKKIWEATKDNSHFSPISDRKIQKMSERFGRNISWRKKGVFPPLRPYCVSTLQGSLAHEWWKWDIWNINKEGKVCWIESEGLHQPICPPTTSSTKQSQKRRSSLQRKNFLLYEVDVIYDQSIRNWLSAAHQFSLMNDLIFRGNPPFLDTQVSLSSMAKYYLVKR